MALVVTKRTKLLRWGAALIVLGITMYPIAIGPMINSNSYSEYYFQKIKCFAKNTVLGYEL